jgi:hypothetical protein
MEWDTTKTQNTIKTYLSYQCSQFKTHKGDTKHKLFKHPLICSFDLIVHCR